MLLRDARMVLLDTETTGVDPAVDHIWECAFRLAEGPKLGVARTRLFCPPVPISEEVKQVCNIDENLLHQILEAGPFGPYAERLVAWMCRRSDEGCVFVAYNGLAFDWPILTAEASRASVHLPTPGPPGTGAPVLLDPLVWVRALHRGRRGRSLADACAGLTDLDPAGAHRAERDCVMTHAVTMALVTRHPAELGGDIEAVWAWQEAARADQERQSQLYGYHVYESPEGPRLGFGKHCGELLRDRADYCGWVLEKFGSEITEATSELMREVAGRRP